MNIGRLPAYALLILVCSGPSSFADDQAVFAFVQDHCVRCHSDKKTSGDLNLVELLDQGRETFDESRDRWEEVASKLKTGEMPPTRTRRPPAVDVDVVTNWLEAEFARQDRDVVPIAGRVTARRLNRTEYNNTIRDLLAINFQPAADFPTDQAAFGFDNISDALRLSPLLLEKYLAAADRVVRTAIFGPEKLKPAVTHHALPVRINHRIGQRIVPDELFHYDHSGLSTIHSAHVMHRFPADGEYSFRIVLNGHRPNQSEPARPALFIDGELVGEFQIDATDLEGQIVETRTTVRAGERLLSVTYLKTYHGLPPDYNGPDPSKRSAEPLLSNNARGDLTEKDIEILRKFGTKIKTNTIEVRIDNRFESIDVGGPFGHQPTPSKESRKKVFVCGHDAGEHNDDCARTIVSSFAERAFRRPPTNQEVDALLSLVSMVRQQGDSFDEGIVTALQAILISPHFLFRIERDRSAPDGQASVPLSDYELASRLSFFLWSSTPDAELLRLAGENQLHNPQTLEHQVRRMLRDEKSKALVENFAGQWLEFKNMDVVQPDVQRFTEFEESLRLSMRRETERFLQEIVREDRSILEILDADYTFVDQRLAWFYGIEGIEGPQFRKVDVSATQRGGGVLSQASILTISSYATRTSPVLRGKWILDKLLNDPPPAPPPTVPELDESKVGESASLRQQMESHRDDPTCASCHARMDSLGFGLEHFDAIGAWRQQDGAFAIDASGTLPSGVSFRGHQELKQVLLKERDAFVKGLAEKLMIYALGRGLERYDRPALARIAEQVSEQDYRFSALVLGIVESLPFQMRSAAGEDSP